MKLKEFLERFTDDDLLIEINNNNNKIDWFDRQLFYGAREDLLFEKDLLDGEVAIVSCDWDWCRELPYLCIYINVNELSDKTR